MQSAIFVFTSCHKVVVTQRNEYMLIRLRMPITVQFRLRETPQRASNSPSDNYLTIRITVNSHRDNGFTAKERFIHEGDGSVTFGNMLIVDSSRWNPVTKQMKGKDQVTIDTNRTIRGIEIDLKDICSLQQRRYDTAQAPPPTADSVKYEYQTGQPPAVMGDVFVYPPSFLARKAKANKPPKEATPELNNVVTGNSPILVVFAAYIKDLKATKLDTGLMHWDTFRKREIAYDWLKNYPQAIDLRARSITPYWLDRYHGWLLSQVSGPPASRKIHLNRRMSKGTASYYCSYLIDAMDWLRAQYIITDNPIARMELPINPTKDVYFLEPLHIEKLFVLEPPEKHAVALWWFKLICLTGLDLPDAIRYAQARQEYEKVTPGGKGKIVIRRAKPPCNECNIPIQDRLIELWEEVHGVSPEPITGETLRNHLKKIAQLIRFEKKLTPKIGRKTSGAILLKKFSIKAISNVLGHSSVTTTERNYVKVTGHQVDHEIDGL